MINNQNQVIFREGEEKEGQRISLFKKQMSEETPDRFVNLIRKLSGGRIQSKKVATYIILILVAVMFVISIIWFIQALR